MDVQSVISNHKFCQQGLLEIDHIFICLSALPAASWLQEAGFVCTEPTLFHADRGTLSQVMFFETMYLEFIAVLDWDVANQFATKTGIDFIARASWQRSGASPFGVALRHKQDGNAFMRSRRSPQPSASNPMDNLPLSFSNENLLAQTNPLCFVVPEAMALTSLIDSTSDRYRRKVCHPLGMERLTQTVIRVRNSSVRSQPIQFLQEAGILTLEPGLKPLLELTFDQHQQNKVLDLQEIDVPLMLKF